MRWFRVRQKNVINRKERKERKEGRLFLQLRNTREPFPFVSFRGAPIRLRRTRRTYLGTSSARANLAYANSFVLASAFVAFSAASPEPSSP